jgi:membrane-bound ClpP family serine protease
MTLTAILLLILVGLVLLLVEILVVPGLIVGIIGGGLMIFGIATTYYTYGSAIGNMVLLGSIITTVASLYFAFRSNTWKKAALNTSLQGKVNVLDENIIKVGEKGITLSRLNPVGKALINDTQVEVQCQDGFLDQNMPIEVVKISSNKIIVQLKK